MMCELLTLHAGEFITLAMFTQADSPRSFLRLEFERRLKRNPRYSLRAFARQIGLQPARLSYVLSGKHGLSRDAAALIASRLGPCSALRPVVETSACN